MQQKQNSVHLQTRPLGGKRSKTGLAAWMLGAALLLAGSALGQTFTSDVVGTVHDPSGKVVAGAEISLRNTETNAQLSTISDEGGRYYFSRMIPGDYQLTAAVAGFQRFVANNLSLTVGTRTTVNIALELGAPNSTVEVVSAGELVQTEDVTVGQVFQQKNITDLPLNGRNFIQLAQLSPGVLQIGSAQSPLTTWTGRTDQAVVVAGLRETDTSYLLDGIETRSPRWGGSGFRPSVDAVEEFNVQRNAFTADQGWGTTVVNTVLRSGSNQFHGTAYHFLRNDVLDARNFFDGERPPFKQNQFGFSIGGPVVRDRVFFFGNYEGFRQRLGTTIQGRVPTAEELQGRLPATDPITGQAVVVVDPLTGEPFPNNQIPAERIDRVIRNVIPLFPLPNRPGDPALNYVRSPSRINDSDQIHVKVDFNLSPSDSVFVRYSWLDEPLVQPTLFEGFGLIRPLGDQNVALSYTRIVNPRLVNEFRIGFNRNRTFNLPEGAFGPDVARDIGLSNTNANPANRGLPSFRVLNFSFFGQNATQTQETIDDIYQFSENVTFHSGPHTLRFGFDLRPDRLHITNDFPSTPTFTFEGRFTGNPVADFLLGYYDIAQNFIGDSSANFRANNWSLYIQDDWKPHPKLNVNLGLRYEYFAPFSEENNKLNYLDFSTQQFVLAQDTLFRPDRNNFGPRLGLAWNPFSKTVFRAGFGVFYDLVAANETQFLGVLNPPVSQIVALSGDPANPGPRVEDLFPSAEFGPSGRPIVANPNDRTPYIYQYNFNIQHEFKGVLVEAGYVGSTGIKLNRRFNANLAVPDPAVPLAQRRPFDQFTDIVSTFNNGWSNYNGFNLKVQKRYSGGLSLLGAYTLGKALDIGGPDEYVHRDVTGTLKDLRGPAQLDSRHRLVVSYVYDLPVGRGKKWLGQLPELANKFLGGWQINGISTFQSGQARTPRAGFDLARIGIRRYQPPNRVGPGNDDNLRGNIRNQPTLFPFFDITDFVSPGAGAIGNGGRGIIVGPGVSNWDMGLLKNTLVGEDVTIQFRAEFFNIFNHAQFLDVGVISTSPTFGRITQARDPRIIQFGLKVLF